MSTVKLRRAGACIDRPKARSLPRFRTLGGSRHTPAARTVVRRPNLATVGFVPSCGRANTDRQRRFPTQRRHRLCEQRRQQCSPERTLRESSFSSVTPPISPALRALGRMLLSRFRTGTASPSPSRTSNSTSALPGDRRLPSSAGGVRSHSRASFVRRARASRYSAPRRGLSAPKRPPSVPMAP
jgi:hypothetical protein